METKEGRYYKKRTTVGYYLLGIISFGVGVVYGLYEDTNLTQLFTKVFDIISNNIEAIACAVGSSFLFYLLFFRIRKIIDEIAVVSDAEHKSSYKLKENELIELREYYLKIKKDKRARTDEQITKEDIWSTKELGYEVDNLKQALVKWLEKRNNIILIAAGYILLVVIILIFLPASSSVKMHFFTPYVGLFCGVTLFYAYLFYSLRIESFMRLSYSVLYPTILTIAVNIYFGLSINELCTESVSCYTYFPLCAYALFFFITAILELLSYNIKKWSKEHFSTCVFVGGSLVVLLASIVIFWISTNVCKNNKLADAFSNLLFAVGLALYLGIFEGWDSLRSMNVSEESSLFAKHYRWWNFLQICYPLIFFFLVGIVKSEIFTFGLMVIFAIVSIASTIVWKRGGEKDAYSKTNWGIRKTVFGMATVIFIFANRLFIMNNFIKLKMPPIGLNTDNINVELIIVLLGALNWMFVFWGVKEDEQKKFVLMALPLKEVKNYNEFIVFCKHGFIYDFCNYVYLIYIFIVHVLLFSTGLLPKGFDGFESASTILIILMIIIYMFFSFKTKFLNNEYGNEEYSSKCICGTETCEKTQNGESLIEEKIKSDSKVPEGSDEKRALSD